MGSTTGNFDAATLLADGKPCRPLGWEGAPPGGHHCKEVLRFEAVMPQPQAVELQIRREGEASPRIFRGKLGQRLGRQRQGHL